MLEDPPKAVMMADAVGEIGVVQEVEVDPAMTLKVYKG
jgi:hypothetical protein